MRGGGGAPIEVAKVGAVKWIQTSVFYPFHCAGAASLVGGAAPAAYPCHPVISSSEIWICVDVSYEKTFFLTMMDARRGARERTGGDSEASHDGS